jgi:hypothetical protein
MNELYAIQHRTDDKTWHLTFCYEKREKAESELARINRTYPGTERRICTYVEGAPLAQLDAWADENDRLRKALLKISKGCARNANLGVGWISRDGAAEISLAALTGTNSSHAEIKLTDAQALKLCRALLHD